MFERKLKHKFSLTMLMIKLIVSQIKADINKINQRWIPKSSDYRISSSTFKSLIFFLDLISVNDEHLKLQNYDIVKMWRILILSKWFYVTNVWQKVNTHLKFSLTIFTITFLVFQINADMNKLNLRWIPTSSYRISSSTFKSLILYLDMISVNNEQLKLQNYDTAKSWRILIVEES